MKVWTLMYYPEHGTNEFHGIFSSKEKAENRAKQLEPNDEKRRYYYSIEEEKVK